MNADTVPRHRTARERAAAASAAAAVTRVQARAASYDPDLDESGPNTGGRVTPALARRIRLEIERRRRG